VQRTRLSHEPARNSFPTKADQAMSLDYCDWPFAKRSQPVAARFGERRASRRQSYPVTQRIAQTVFEPTADDIQSVRCHDVSSVGFSYWDTQPPRSDQLVVELGVGDDRQPLVAEIRHCTVVTCWQSPLVLIGCHIVGKANMLPAIDIDRSTEGQ
jgi:hypothetical protein